MNDISIIINGTRYDAVLVTYDEFMDYKNGICYYCDMCIECNAYDWYDLCADNLGGMRVFKKSKKKFEK